MSRYCRLSQMLAVLALTVSIAARNDVGRVLNPPGRVKNPSHIDRVEKLLSRMTLEEKLGQLTQLVEDQPEFQPALQKGFLGSVLNSGGAARTNELQRA